MTRVWIKSAGFSDGSTIQFNENDIVVFVGPNNAGKSASLKEMVWSINQNDYIKNNVIKKITIGKIGAVDEMISDLETISKPEYNYGKLNYKIPNGTIDDPSARKFWNNDNGLHSLTSLYIKSVSTEGRLTSVKPPKNINLTQDLYVHPIHFLQSDDSLEKRFSEYFRQAFGTDLIVHHVAGSEVPLYVGNRPIPAAGEDRVSRNYLNALEKLDLLHLQGDGMRAFVGVLLNAFISNHSVLFIDEPEAFLHPPQARLLGKMLAKDLPQQRQLFLATHSEDFLKGLLDSNVQNLKIIRIERDENINNISVLDSASIDEIWNDSILRHSNILNGLFHSKVVICESDSDCRFFSAILSSLFDQKGSIAPDILFVQCGGKHRMPTVIKALKKLNVQIKVISDFDILNDENPLKPTFENLGGNWDEVVADWKIVKTQIESKRPEFLTSDLKTEIDRIFSETSERNFPKQKIVEIQKALKKSSAWTEAKANGKSYIPSGQASQAFERIQSKFKDKGLLVLEVGEIECFDKSVGNHGPKWVIDVLSKNLIAAPELELARQFVLSNLA
jgi:predicted ATPase